MPRLSLTFVTGLVALQSAAGASLRSSNGAAADGRRLQEGLCNSIGCPGGFTPIPNAWEVECGDSCDVATCCEAFCSYHACPDGYIPIEDAGTTRCTNDDCTTEQCCVSGDDRWNKCPPQPLPSGPHGKTYCNSIGCPGGYTPIPNAWEVECDDDSCEVSQCCEAYCSYYACPDSYIPIEDAGTTRCTDDDCTAEQCCVSGDTGDSKTYCNSIGCPGGYTPIPNAWEVECDDDSCEVSQCCEAYCSYYACPDGHIPIEDAGTTRCTDDDCTTEQCCESH
ncbi:unnamed protein product [Ectocarpus sp. 13 AM-2016]